MNPRRRQMRDSQNAFEVCVILMLFIMVVMLLFGLAADAIDKALTEDAAELDRQLSPSQRALNSAGMHATTLSQQAIISADLERQDKGATK